ncbi:MAG: GC-type dockerin domain-anchored protein, partial [Bacteroidota bacterium]
LFTFMGSSWAQDIVGAEYYWDEDPGVGNGSFLSIASGNEINTNLNIETGNLPGGVHLLGIRTLDSEGRWSVPSVHQIMIRSIEGVEYFWNEDPGMGNGTFVELEDDSGSIDEDLTFNSTGTRPGKNLLGVRAKWVNGSYGVTEYRTVVVEGELAEGEYFWDTDPGTGNAIPFSVETAAGFSDAEVEFTTVGLTTGYHDLYVRMKSGGIYGPPKKKRLYVTQEIAGGEYFWDSDPGVGNGESIAVLSLGTSAQLCQQVPTTGLSLGEHYLYVRTVTEDDVWSVPSRVQITITESDIIVGCLGDFDRNGIVNGSDLLTFLSFFGSQGECTADLNGDFVVNGSDLLTFLSLFGEEC